MRQSMWFFSQSYSNCKSVVHCLELCHSGNIKYYDVLPIATYLYICIPNWINNIYMTTSHVIYTVQSYYLLYIGREWIRVSACTHRYVPTGMYTSWLSLVSCSIVETVHTYYVHICTYYCVFFALLHSHLLVHTP